MQGNEIIYISGEPCVSQEVSYRYYKLDLIGPSLPSDICILFSIRWDKEKISTPIDTNLINYNCGPLLPSVEAKYASRMIEISSKIKYLKHP